MNNQSTYLSLKRRINLEKQITQAIYDDNRASAHFDYHYQTLNPNDPTSQKQTVLTLITSNPAHQEHFTMYTTEPHDTDLECLDEVKSFLDQKKQQRNQFNYTVKWIRAGNTSEMFTSYFSGRNFPEIINKFFENKNPDDFVICQVKLSPES